MNSRIIRFVCLGLVLAAPAVSCAATRYVTRVNAAPQAPFTNWVTAATNIQDAVDASQDGDIVLVSNGVFNTGSRITPDRVLLNRVAITNAVAVRSVNGPAVTTIAGEPDGGTLGYGTGAVRCVYLAPGAELSGFTLTNGYTLVSDVSAYNLSGAGALLSFGGVLSNCVLRGNYASYYGAGAYCRGGGLVVDCTIDANHADDSAGGAFCFAGGEFRHCVISGNTATNLATGGNGYGGAAYAYQTGAFVNCTIVSNQAQYGGALFLNGGTVDSCTIRSNQAVNYAGGVYVWADGVITNCTLDANQAGSWGGAALLYGGGLVANCTISYNTAGSYGGGVVVFQTGAARFCTFATNHSGYEGGGVMLYSAPNGLVSNCTFKGNAADSNGGGAYISFGGEIDDSTFTSNTSYSGAGVYVENTGLVIRAVMRGNAAAFNGGAFYFNQGGNASRCTLSGNSASQGGGVYTLNGGALDNSLVVGNSAQQGGGCAGVDWFGTPGVLANCTVVSNTAADQGGGAFESSLVNCIVARNSAANSAPNWKDGTLRYCCTTPMPTGTVGSITNAPLFINPAAGDWRPKFGSRVIDAGDSGAVTGVVDLAGFARIVGSSVDIGAHEYDGEKYDSDSDTMADAWEARYGLNPTNAADAAAQGDSDGIPNWKEFVADTNPTNSGSYFHVVEADRTNAFDIAFVCSTARVYSLECSTSLVSGAWTALPGATGIPGATNGVMTLADTNTMPACAYRIVVSLP